MIPFPSLDSQNQDVGVAVFTSSLCASKTDDSQRSPGGAVLCLGRTLARLPLRPGMGEVFTLQNVKKTCGKRGECVENIGF